MNVRHRFAAGLLVTTGLGGVIGALFPDTVGAPAGLFSGFLAWTLTQLAFLTGTGDPL